LESFIALRVEESVRLSPTLECGVGPRAMNTMQPVCSWAAVSLHRDFYIISKCMKVCIGYWPIT